MKMLIICVAVIGSLLATGGCCTVCEVKNYLTRCDSCHGSIYTEMDAPCGGLINKGNRRFYD